MMAAAVAIERARDGARWSRVSPRKEPQPVTQMAPTTLLFAVAMAVAVKAVNLPFAYRGHPPVYLGARARARAAGYMNVKHQQRVEREKAEQAAREQHLNSGL